MRFKASIWLAAIGFFWAGAALAGVYSWTDGQGIKHFANVQPTDQHNVNNLESMEEIPYDRQADEYRMQQEQASRQAAEREAQIVKSTRRQEEQEAEKRQLQQQQEAKTEASAESSYSKDDYSYARKQRLREEAQKLPGYYNPKQQQPKVPQP